MFSPAKGFPYRRFFRRLHSKYIFDWYLEIGCREGTILSMVQGKTIGVDPHFRLSSGVLGKKPEMLLYQEESDTFFANERLERLGAKISVAFIDGMHLFEYALRDVLNTERSMAPDGVIFVHDCFPRNTKMTTRDLSSLPEIWTGDVWKLIPILQEHRPDLKLTAFDAAPTGLLAITGLDPKQSHLKIGTSLDDIVSHYQDMEIDEFGIERFFEQLPFSSALDEVRASFPIAAHLHRPELALPEASIVTP